MFHSYSYPSRLINLETFKIFLSDNEIDSHRAVDYFNAFRLEQRNFKFVTFGQFVNGK